MLPLPTAPAQFTPTQGAGGERERKARKRRRGERRGTGLPGPLAFGSRTIKPLQDGRWRQAVWALLCKR